MSNLTHQLVTIAKKMQYHFSLKGRPLTYQEVFANDGALPGLMKRADQLAALCLGNDLGTSYSDEEAALLGMTVTLNDYTPDSLRILCIIDVLYEIIRMSPDPSQVSLDELLYD